MRPGKLRTRQQPLVHQRVSFVLRLRQSFPEDCVRLKLSSTRASQAGLKEMMMQMKNERTSEQWSKETIRPALSYRTVLEMQ